MSETQHALTTLLNGTSQVIQAEEIESKLKLNRPLRVKLGVDPTSADLHLGHTVALEKLRQFQSFGHQAVLIIGDCTATIGDPTGRTMTRLPLSQEQVIENSQTYRDQAFKILDPKNTEIHYNSKWFNTMSFADILSLNSKMTLQQVIQREDFKKRISEEKEIRLHELQYPLMQGWDSVQIKSDIEIGGTDQLFNMLVGRELQKQLNELPQSVILMPLLEGLNGKQKMSKSYQNSIGITENPVEMFGKIMSLSDDLMDRYYLLLLGKSRNQALHPMEAKKQLASLLTSRYHNKEQAQKTNDEWNLRFSDKELNQIELPTISLNCFTYPLTYLQLGKTAFLEGFQLEKSNAELKRQILAGAIQINEEKISNPNDLFEPKAEDILRLSKKHAIRLVN